MSGTLTLNVNSYDQSHTTNRSILEHSQENIPTERSNNNNSIKKILLYKNGDKYFPPKRFVINKKQIRTWDSFLEQLTKTIQPCNGAIRDIRTPFHGTRIKSLDDIRVNGKYVVVSKGESMKLMDYASVVDVSSPSYHNNQERPRARPVKLTNHEMDKIESRINQQLYTKGVVIHVYRNGDPFTRGIKVVLNTFEQKHMNTLVRAIEERIVLPSNRPIRRLYTMDGELVKYAKDVADGHCYVAASNEQFNNIKYGQYLPVIRGGKIHSSNRRVKYLNQSPTPVRDHPPEIYEHEPTTRRSQKSSFNSERNKQQPLNKNIKRPVKTKRIIKALAASKIQASFRGYMMRCRITKMDEVDSVRRIRYHYDAEKINLKQTYYKSDIPSKKRIDEKPLERKEKYYFDKHLAASKIQAAFRGYLFRKKMAKPKVIYNKKNTFIKKKTNDEENKRLSAIKIQAAFRAFKVRQPLRIEDNNKRRERAAMIIQYSYLGYKTRMEIFMKKELQRKEEAAIKIQSSYRPYKVRQRFGIQNKEMMRNAAVTIQSAYRGFVTRKVSNLKKERIINAAKTIQYAYRGYKTRERLKLNDQITRQTAAKKIQYAYRGYKSRLNLKEEMQRKMAARTIQYAFRGYRTRKILDLKEKARRQIAAKKIQYAYRGFKTRERCNLKEQRQIAARTIQYAYRGYRTREMLRLKRETQRQIAAKKIQSAYRGYRTRERIKLKAERIKIIAAKTIQSAYRGYKTREKIRTNAEIFRNEAAIVIQSGYKGFKTRMRIKESKVNENKEASAKIIQASFRGFQIRKTIRNDLNARLHEKTAEEQALERQKAATKIQASFRGFKARKNIAA